MNRYFDLPWNALTEQGKLAEGRLATNRPHTFRFFTGYTLKSKLGSSNVAPVLYVYSGTPITTELGIDGLPTYPYNRGNLGRTPIFNQTDLLLSHEFTPFKNEVRRIRVEFNARNLFDQQRVVDKFVTLNHVLDGDASVDNPLDLFKGFNGKSLLSAQEIRTDPRYGMASSFQSPREMRFAIRFMF